jgi:hypothetical protein
MRNAPAFQQQQQQRQGGGGGGTTAVGLLDAHYEKFASAMHRRDGELLATAVSVDCILRDCFNTKIGGGAPPPSENDVKECKRRRSSSSSSSDRRVPAPFDDVWEKLAMASLELKRNAFEKCYDYHNEAMAFFIKDFKAREEPEDVIWTIKAMKRMTRDSRLCAEKADRNSRKVGKKATRLETCGAQLMQAYRCSSQTSTREKKLAQLKIVNELFKIYFELNALHLCKNLVNAVNLPTFLPFEESFPSSEKVTYHFYVGRLAVFDDDYEGASEHLKYAFERCPKGSSKNKTACLKYLVPVMLSLGFVPSKKLFAKYKEALKPYEEVCEAVKTGKLGVLEQALERRKARFVREGTYLVFEKLRLYCLRTLFKKTSEIQKEFEPEKANQVKLEMLSKACKIAASMKSQHGNNANASTNNKNLNNTDYDLDEVECGISELIHRKFVKGYVSHKNRVVVLSKTDAFPKISDVVK